MDKPTPAEIEAASKAAWSVFAPDDEWESRHFYSQKCKTMDAVEAALVAASHIRHNIKLPQGE